MRENRIVARLDDPRREQRLAALRLIRLAQRRIELDQQITCLDELTVLHVDRAHRTDLARPHQTYRIQMIGRAKLPAVFVSAVPRASDSGCLTPLGKFASAFLDRLGQPAALLA